MAALRHHHKPRQAGGESSKKAPHRAHQGNPFSGSVGHSAAQRGHFFTRDLLSGAQVELSGLHGVRERRPLIRRHGDDGLGSLTVPQRHHAGYVHGHLRAIAHPGRWITEHGRVPRARYRWIICEVLGVDESVLWPAAAKKAIKVGPDREVVSVYPYRSGCPATLWRSLITKAERELTFAGYTNYFLWLEQSRFGTALRRKAA